jgi:hypothetical protein
MVRRPQMGLPHTCIHHYLHIPPPLPAYPSIITCIYLHHYLTPVITCLYLHHYLTLPPSLPDSPSYRYSRLSPQFITLLLLRPYQAPLSFQLPCHFGASSRLCLRHVTETVFCVVASKNVLFHLRCLSLSMKRGPSLTMHQRV